MKIFKVILVVFLVLALLGGAAAAILNYNGLLSFYHPMQTPRDGQIRVACVGDSVTYGFGIKNRKALNYPAVLQGLLGDGYCVNNFGYSGRTASGVGDRPYTEEKLFQQSLDFQPDIVVLMLGSNDSKAENWNEAAFRADYAALLDAYQAALGEKNGKLFVVLPTPVFEEENGVVKFGIGKEIIAEKIVPLTRAIAQEKGAEIIDMYSVFADRSDLFSDGCHPTADGAALYAQTVYAAIKA